MTDSASTPSNGSESPVDNKGIALVLLRDEVEHRRRFDLSGPATVIGRREECDLRIPLGDVSRKHCAILRGDEGELRLHDLGSSNGTYVNGRRVQESPLLAGDVIRVGSLKFLVQVDGAPADVEARPAESDLAGTDHAGQSAPLNPTAQADVADYGLDPSDAASPMTDLMED
jgi:pSer/pThr/pTyr-binding forkhead associated (FHA) protein